MSLKKQPYGICDQCELRLDQNLYCSMKYGMGVKHSTNKLRRPSSDFEDV